MYLGQNFKKEAVMYEAFSAEKCVELNCFVTAFLADYGRDYQFEGEMHDFWEVFCVLEGDVCVSADERIVHLTGDDVIFHKPMELHRFQIEHDRPVSVFIMSFDAHGPAMKQLENCVLRLSREQKENLLRVISFLRGTFKPGGTCPAGLAALEKNALSFQQFSCLVELFLLSAAKERNRAAAGGPGIGGKDGAVLGEQGGPAAGEEQDSAPPETLVYRTAVQMMEKRVGEWPSVAEIARDCHVSASYLKNIFRKYAGLGVHRYFLKTKIIRASRMLKEGRTVAETAAALAFSSPNYFSVVYKREAGVTPTEYRRAGRLKANGAEVELHVSKEGRA